MVLIPRGGRKLPDELKRELVLMLEQLKLDVQEDRITGVQAVCLTADGHGHQVNGGDVGLVMVAMHRQFTIELTQYGLKYTPFLHPQKEVKP